MTEVAARVAAGAVDTLPACALAAACYRERGWQVGAYRGQVWLRAGHPFEALETSPEIGRQARAFLTALRTATPIIEVPGSPVRWVLLTEPHRDQLPETRRFLAGAGVRHLRAGAEIDLPPTGSPEGTARWVVGYRTPACGFVLVASALMAATT